MRHVAIEGGGDWADASVTYLLVPDGVDVEAEKALYHDWLRREYHPARKRGQSIRWLNFDTWLIERCGAKPNDEIEVYNDGYF